MADADREEKLAAARKKLKKFQQKRTPSSPTVRELKPPLLNSSIDSPNSSESVGIPLTTESHGNISPHEEAAGLQPINGAYRLEDNSAQTHQALESNHRGGPSSTTLNDREYTTTEKIKQLCRQINGLMSQDFYINGEDPVFHEIESLENRNHQLEERVQSYKRSNDQLNNQVNEQRRQIIQFQEQIKRERTELANKQLLEQRSLKEQLEVHIQTIGILVGEKQELQSTVSQLQRKYDIKQSENTELTSRLQTVRQKAGELEKNLANITATCEKHQDDAKRFRQERDKYQTATYTQNQEKEELLQQNAELRVKLEAKLVECEQLNKNESELSLKLKQAELVVQQLSGEPSSSETHNLVQQLQTEKTDLENKLEQVNATIQKIAAEKGELLQQRADEVDQYERRIRSLTEEAETCEREKKALILRETELHNSLQSLQKELADLRDKEATNQMESTQLAAVEIERLAEDKQRLAEHLQKEGRENDRLVREQERYVLRIQELESTLSRMGEEAIDKATLLETAQSDKETISRALKQNKELKEKMEELEERFVTMSQENMKLTTSLETERHAAKELASKLSGTGVELEEAKQLLFSRTDEIQALREELNVTSENLREQVTEGENMVSSLRDELDISSQQWQEQLRHKDFEISAVREELELSSQELAEQLARKDVELASLKNELTHSEARLTEQFLLNENNEEFKNQSEVLNTLQHQLLIAQNAINQLTAQNAELQEMLRNTENSGSMEPSGTESSDEDEASKRAGNGSHVHHIHTVATDSEDGEILVKRQPPDVIPVQAPERMLEESPPYMNGTFSEGESPAETDSSEDMNMTPHRPLHPPHPSKYTSREDVVDSLSASIRQLEMERDQLADILHRTRDESEDDFQRLHQHMQLQLNQQLQQQYRQVQEQFQQQLHEQQQKIQLLQAVVEKQKSQIEKKEEPELPNIPLEQDDMSHDAIKMAFSKLQARFMKLMNEKASLIERIQELEHITVQLSMETETIGEYITLYQTQRNALKSHYKDRERLITQLSSEKANMQEKMNQLQDLVKQMLDERKELRLQQHQLQSVINSKMVAHEHQSAIPSFQDGDEVIVQREQTEVASERNTMDNSELWSKSFLEKETELSEIDNSKQFDQNDGTAHQILQILEQLGPTEEGTQSGWMSPDVRCREFLPCRYCGGRVLRL